VVCDVVENFVTILLNNLMALMPFVIVRTYQRGVRWRLGRFPFELKPGLHLKLWLYHQVELVDVVDEVIDLPVQSVITEDEKLVCFSVNIGYRVVDVVKHWNSVQDFHEATAGIAMTHMAKKVREKKLPELLQDLSKLERSLEGTLTTRFKDWGTEVFSVGFTDFAEVPTQIRLFGDKAKVIPTHHFTHGELR
jgi:regulator of protease activity HflC (stomatin/prohibitin superfamily)